LAQAILAHGLSVVISCAFMESSDVSLSRNQVKEDGLPGFEKQ